ncbi:MAG: hypothetical protein KJP18_15015 [Gemmatimonadetes bacterium]|nr:hypothetical protein [Gemmatimonadota bacterium]
MKTKLTVTVDRDLLPRAKQVARERGVSLSSIIEGALRELTAPDVPTFSQRWRGAFELRDSEDPRARALREKYG